MKITFEVQPEPISEAVMLRMFLDDWGYDRAPRDAPTRNLLFTSPNRKFWVATILTPEQHKGKIAGYCGLGIFDDMLIDSGAYTLGGNALEQAERAENLRGNGVYVALREVRNEAAEELAKSSNLPFVVLLKEGSPAGDYYIGRGYSHNDTNIPEWALAKLEGRNWYVYNPNVNKAMMKAWAVIKGE